VREEASVHRCTGARVDWYTVSKQSGSVEEGMGARPWPVDHSNLLPVLNGGALEPAHAVLIVCIYVTCFTHSPRPPPRPV